jgi:DNA-binding transcriptional ArsR family regulator
MLALDALGNPVRRQILHLLQTEPMAVGALAEHFPISRPAVSRHLRVLRDAGLITANAQGRENLYALQIDGFAQAQGWLEGFWDEALMRYALVTENTRD